MQLAPSRRAAVLGLILLLGIATRVPGLFWGYGAFGSQILVLHPDEPEYTLGRHEETAYPRGLSVNVGLLSRLLAAAGVPGVARGERYDLLLGRIVSLAYGVLTLLVVYRLARAVFRDDRIALLSAFFLSLANLHVTYSHIGIPDSAATFWFWAALATAHTALARESRRAALLSAVCSGAAGAMRYQATSLVPLVFWVARSRGRIWKGLLVLVGVATSFLVFSGLSVNLRGAWTLLTNVMVWGDLGWRKIFLPVVYLTALLVGVGLPVFVLAGYGLLAFAREKRAIWRGWREVLADHDLPIVLAPAVAFLQASTVALWAPRHVTVLTPFLAMLGAYGVVRLPVTALGPVSAQAVRGALVAAIALYSAVHVASVQAYFVDDPLERAGRWLRANVPAGVTLSVFVAEVPPEYPTIAEWEGNYLVLSARGYGRYRYKHFLPSWLTGRFPEPREIYGGTRKDAERLQKVFRGELPYRLVKRIRLRFYTPELILSHAYWYSQPHLYEVLIYERERQRAVEVPLLTPSRADHLVTLDAGPLWRPDPGQEIRLSVNGHPLAVRLRPGTNHLILPAASVTPPTSRLRLASAQPLPHLPPHFLARVRPLGREFSVESLLDDDLFAEGFAPPEVGADGATWRWTDGAGRILVPPPRTAQPWRRLAARLKGDPERAPQTAVFFLDGRRVGEVLLTGGARTVEFALPPGPFIGDVVPLEIVSPARRTAPDGSRRGVAVFWVGLTRGAALRRAYPDGDPAGVAGPSWRPLFGLGVDYRVERVSFPSGALTLRADLFLPRAGGGSAIILAHGASPLGRKHGLYLALARRLAEKGFVVLNPDLRGYGESQDPPRVAAASDLDFSSDLVAAVDYLERRLGVKAITVVGHSFGGGVALAAAARDARVGRVVAISPGRRAHELILGSPAGRRHIRDRMIGEMGLREEQFPLELAEPVIVPIIIDSYVDHPFRQPVLLVDGEREDPADLRFLRDVARRMKATTAYVTIPGAEHYFGIQQRAEERDPVTLGSLADVIEGWIREGATWTRTP